MNTVETKIEYKIKDQNIFFRIAQQSTSVTMTLHISIKSVSDWFNWCVFMMHYWACPNVFQQDLQCHIMSVSPWWWVTVWPDSLCPGKWIRPAMDPLRVMWWVTRTSCVTPHPLPAPWHQWAVGRFTPSRSPPPTRPGPAPHPAPQFSSPVSIRDLIRNR